MKCLRREGRHTTPVFVRPQKTSQNQLSRHWLTFFLPTTHSFRLAYLRPFTVFLKSSYSSFEPRHDTNNGFEYFILYLF